MNKTIFLEWHSKCKQGVIELIITCGWFRILRDSVCCLKKWFFFAIEITNTRAGRKFALLAIANDEILNVQKINVSELFRDNALVSYVSLLYETIHVTSVTINILHSV